MRIYLLKISAKVRGILDFNFYNCVILLKSFAVSL